MECQYTRVWKEMATIYRKMRLSEEEIAKRIICKTNRKEERVGCVR